ncbi:hypothetical protein HIM_03551 [Hirsutella minnesotensis 3608]|uniref:Uncharacterized protein n=1 Tax=Hirsutella minnesotensis 3608 TaxID=1043627 RepID=A0A0F7ZQG9_9HYPO|nr:hypothetical protein HIM_03551 [Hirsutella minnesotensis 3608]
MGIENRSEDENTGGPNRPDGFAISWAEAIVTTGACFLLAQGYYGIRAARERMERVKQTAVTLAYAFTKTTIPNSEHGHDKEDLQLLIYECLALLTAYPVALLEQMRGNTCEPAISKYCQDVALTLKRLRRGENGPIKSQSYESGYWSQGQQGVQQFATVEHFFEIFSLQLHLEYSKQTMRTKGPSLSTQHIIYTLRNHFENLVDLRNVDDRRTPIIRENIDMMSLAGRECAIFAIIDVIPLAFLWAVYSSGLVVALYCPVKLCESISDWAPVVEPGQIRIVYPSMYSLLAMASLSTASAVLLTCLSEMWAMWDPYGSGTNTFAWTLGIALEIDNILNEFYEYDTSNLVRVHSYMDTAGCLHRAGTDDYDNSGNRAQTV